MAWTPIGHQLTDADSGIMNIVFAKDQNQLIMADRGFNKVISGVAPTANGASNLTSQAQADIDISSGSVTVDGTEVSVTGQGISLYSSAVTNFDSGDGYNDLSPGESVWLFVYIDAAGTLHAIGGNKGSGTIYPPEIFEDVCTIARIYLTEGTTTLQAAAIRDYRIYTPNKIYAAGGKIAGAFEITGAIIAGSTVDGRNVAADGTRLDGISTQIDSITDVEAQQIQNIGTSTIGATAWGKLDTIDQNLGTIYTPSFAGLKVTAPSASGTFGGMVSWNSSTFEYYYLSTANARNALGVGTGQTPTFLGISVNNINMVVPGTYINMDGAGAYLKINGNSAYALIRNVMISDNSVMAWNENGNLALGGDGSGEILLFSNTNLIGNGIKGNGFDLSNADFQLIGAVSAAQWGHVGNMNQNVSQTSNVKFNQIVLENGSNDITILTDGTHGLLINFLANYGAFAPYDDNQHDCGNSTHRWDDIWATNGNIQTSMKVNKNILGDLESRDDGFKQIKAVRYKWKKGKSKDHNTIRIGFIAEEVAIHYPEAIKYDKENKILGMYYDRLIPVLWEKVQRLQEQINLLSN